MRLDDEVLAWYRNSRAAYHRGDLSTAETWYRRLRAEHGLELFYEVELPENIRFVHPLGTVLGRANYGDHLVVYHGCGVGSDLDGNRPTLGDGIVLFPGAKILGNTRIGNNVFVEANTVVRGKIIPDNCIVNGTWRELVIRPTTRSVKKHFFGVE